MRSSIVLLGMVASVVYSADSFSAGILMRQQLTDDVARRLRDAPAATSDYLRAILHSRSQQVQKIGDRAVQKVGMAESLSISGLMFEQRYARLMTKGHMTYDVFFAGDEATDLLGTDKRTGAQQRLQLYAGKVTRTAIDKLLISDRAAEILVLPSDTYDQIIIVLEEAQSIWRRRQSGAASHAEVVASLRKLLSPHGFSVDELGHVSFGSGRGFAVALGTPDEAGFKAPFLSLERWRETSATLISKTEMARLQAKSTYHHLLVDYSAQLGSRAEAARAINRFIKQEAGPWADFHNLTAAGERHEARAAAWAAAKEEALRFARTVNLPQDRVHSAFRERANPGAFGARAALRAAQGAALTAIRTQWIAHALYRPYALGAGSFVTLISAGGLLQWQMGPKVSFIEWAKSHEGTAYIIRAGTGGLSLAAGFAVERALWSWSVAGANAGRSTLRSFAGIGAATAVFVLGEALLQRCYYGASWAETAGAVGESVSLIAISTGLTWGIVTIGGISGSWAGPVGIGVGMAVSAIYSGATYYWDETNARELDKRIWDARRKTTEKYLESRSTLQRLTK